MDSDVGPFKRPRIWAVLKPQLSPYRSFEYESWAVEERVGGMLIRGSILALKALWVTALGCSFRITHKRIELVFHEL
jgi:hypothetical protein